MDKELVVHIIDEKIHFYVETLPHFFYREFSLSHIATWQQRSSKVIVQRPLTEDKLQTK